MRPEASIGDALDASARALEAVADVLRRLAESEEFAHLRARLGDGTAKQALSIAATARLLSVSPGFVVGLIKSGQLEGRRLSPRVWRVDRSAIESYCRRRAALTPGGPAATAAAK